jgi:hypothetical protein
MDAWWQLGSDNQCIQCQQQCGCHYPNPFISGGDIQRTTFYRGSSDLCVVVPTKHIHIGGSINYFGYAAFNQQRMAIAVAKKLAPAFSLGVQLNYVSTFIQDYGTTGNPVLGIGLYAAPISKLSIGFVVFNPTQTTYGKNINEKIPGYARLGMRYMVSEKLKLITEADQQLNSKLVVRLGLDYQLHEIMHLAIGAATNPTYLTFGTTIMVKKMRVDFAVSKHEILGITPHLGILFPVKP